MLNPASHIVEYKNIVIGCTLESLLYSYIHNFPFVFTQSQEPHFLDLFDLEDDVSSFHMNEKQRNSFLNRFGSLKDKKYEKTVLFQKLFFFLSLNGLSLTPYELESILIENNELKCYTKYGRMVKFKCEKFHIFDDFNVQGLPEPIKQKEIIYKVYDWINVRSCSPHSYDNIITKDSFVSEILFYKSPRIWQGLVKDIVTISKISESNLRQFDYSDTNVRYKIIYHLKELGIKGLESLNKRWVCHKRIKLDFEKRDLIPLNKKNVYKNTHKFVFCNFSYKELLNLKSPLKKKFDKLC